MQSEALKSCPFCGSVGSPTTANGETWVSCASCDASSRMCSTEAGAIAAWNTRPSEDLAAHVPGLVEALKEALAFIDSIEGHGYGGIAGYMCAQDAARTALSRLPTASRGGSDV